MQHRGPTAEELEQAAAVLLAELEVRQAASSAALLSGVMTARRSKSSLTKGRFYHRTNA